MKKEKFIALVIVFPLLAINCSTIAPTVSEKRFEQRRKKGAKIAIQKKDGHQLQGELIAVKESSLLMMVSGDDVSVDIRDINVIRIVKKSKFLLGLGAGFFIGFLTAKIIDETTSNSRQRLRQYEFYTPWAGFTLAGGIVGILSGIDETIKIEEKLFEEKIPRYERKMVKGKPQLIRKDTELEEILEKLRSKARIPDYK